MASYFFSIPKVYFGEDAIKALRQLNHKKVGIVTDSFMATSGKARYLIGEMPQASVSIFSDVKPDPSVEILQAGAAQSKAFKPDVALLNKSEQLDVAKALAKRRAAEPIRREYLPGYHESRDGLKALGAQRHHYINLACAENRATGLGTGERPTAGEQQLGVLICMQKIEQAAFDEAIRQGKSPTDAVLDVAHRMEMFASLMSPRGMLQ